MVHINPTISITPLNLSVLNTPVKRQTVKVDLKNKTQFYVVYKYIIHRL